MPFIKSLNCERKTTQPVNKTDWFFLAGILDARARRRLKWKLKQNFFIVFFYFPLQMTEGKAGNTAKG